jgi:hypothetical protein
MPELLDLAAFLQTNSSAVFGLLGALGGGVLSYIATSLHKRREFDLQIWSKLFDRRIAAHEKVIALAVEMRVMVVLGGVDSRGEVRRSPQVLFSKEQFEEWFTRFTQLSLEGTTWLSTSTKREVNLVQDYLITLHMHLAAIPSARYLEVGEIVREDFVDLSSSLEKKAFEFFTSDIKKLQLNNLEKWHKYKRAVTERRLQATMLISRLEQVRALESSYGDASHPVLNDGESA